MRSATWVIVSSELVETSGQGMANLALARFLAGRGTAVRVVAHRCDPGLVAPGQEATWRRVPQPLGSAFLGERLLARVGRWEARRARSRVPGARVVVNGGNCSWGDVAWVHMVHHAWRPQVAASRMQGLRLALTGHVDRRREREVLRAARLVVANSELTRADLVRHLGLEARRIPVVYLGVDPGRFGPVDQAERVASRRELGLAVAAPIASFVGGVGLDGRKGFDHLFAAWVHVIRATPGAVLLVVGGGALEQWRGAARRAGLADSILFLGHVPGVERVLAAADLLVSPSRYDSYGMNVQEAIARGIPILASRAMGVAERIPPSLRRLVIPPPGEEPPQALAARIQEALRPDAELQAGYAELSRAIRARTWDDMAAELVGVIEAGPVP